jgi:hypothetical protein
VEPVVRRCPVELGAANPAFLSFDKGVPIDGRLGSLMETPVILSGSASGC